MCINRRFQNTFLIHQCRYLFVSDKRIPILERQERLHDYTVVFKFNFDRLNHARVHRSVTKTATLIYVNFSILVEEMITQGEIFVCVCLLKLPEVLNFFLRYQQSTWDAPRGNDNTTENTYYLYESTSMLGSVIKSDV